VINILVLSISGPVTQFIISFHYLPVMLYVMLCSYIVKQSKAKLSP
jgi:hypothetical protein